MEQMWAGADRIDDNLFEIVPQPLILTDVNDYCKIKIFEYLTCTDLLSVSETNEQLRGAVCDVFKQKYFFAKIRLARLWSLKDFQKKNFKFGANSMFLNKNITKLLSI